jgi:NTE family protein
MSTDSSAPYGSTAPDIVPATPNESVGPNDSVKPNESVRHGELITTGESAERSSDRDQRSISVAFGAGGARGISHLGVMQAFIELGFRFDHLCGISIGAVASALCAVDSDIERVQSKAIDFVDSPEFKRHRQQMFATAPTQGSNSSTSGWLRRVKRLISAHQKLTRAIRGSSILPAEVLKHVTETLLPDIGIEETKLPLSIIAVDLLSGQRVELRRGSLREAVRASASIPGVFPPVPWEDKLLCDIGVFEAVPAVTARKYAKDLTVAVDISNGISPIEGCKNILEVFNRVQSLAEYQLRHHSLSQADVVIQPSVQGRAWFEFESREGLISTGYETAKKAIAAFVQS